MMMLSTPKQLLYYLGLIQTLELSRNKFLLGNRQSISVQIVEVFHPCRNEVIQRLLAVWGRDHRVQESAAKCLPELQ